MNATTSLKYRVSHKVIGTKLPYADGSSIVITDDFGKIPSIIAIKRGLKAENIVVTNLALIED